MGIFGWKYRGDRLGFQGIKHLEGKTKQQEMRHIAGALGNSMGPKCDYPWPSLSAPSSKRKHFSVALWKHTAVAQPHGKSSRQFSCLHWSYVFYLPILTPIISGVGDIIMYIFTASTRLYPTGKPGMFRQRPQEESSVLSATTTFEAIAAQKPLQVNLHSGMTWTQQGQGVSTWE